MPDETDETDEIPCPPCRGTGRLTSTLGGTPHEVQCPWCEGSGRFMPGHDAQQAQSGGEPGVHGQSSTSAADG
jgi:DnaJ-class molecular chaperone